LQLESPRNKPNGFFFCFKNWVINKILSQEKIEIAVSNVSNLKLIELLDFPKSEFNGSKKGMRKEIMWHI